MVHVVPIGEFEQHELDSTCPCGCTLDFTYAEILAVHTAFDLGYDDEWGVYQTE